MKKFTKKLRLFVLISIFGSSAISASIAQQKLIHYWHFDNFTSVPGGAVDPATLIPIHANWSSIDSTKAVIAYVPVSKLSAKYQTYWDNNTGDTLNARGAGKTRTAAGWLALRVRNPSDSMQLLFKMPTNKYKNITLKYETQKSSLTSGMGAQLFSYSSDGGTTWKTSGLSVLSDSLPDKSWGLIKVSMATDTTVNNNPDFIFRIKFRTFNTGTSGNNRFDNVTLEGDTIGNTPPPPSSLRLIHYWHFDNFNPGLSAGVDPATLVPIHSNWSSIDSTKATISYVPVGKLSTKYLTFWDNNVGDTINARVTGKTRPAAAWLSLRVRNPSDSMQLLFKMPTNKYKNITLKYETQKSSLTSGMGAQLFSYSTDGGTTWKTSGLSVLSDSLPDKNWGLIKVSLATDTTVNNNADFIFRVKFRTFNTGTSGNNRFDNVTLEGDTDKVVGTTPPPNGQKLIHYFHFNNLSTGLTAAVSPSVIKPVHANWSTLDSTKAIISYVAAYKNVSAKYTTWWDAYAMTVADSNLNARRGAPAGNSLRVRNPSDSMELLFALPTLHYKNLTLKFGSEKSSLGSGQLKMVYDYSINGGSNWKTAGISIPGDSTHLQNTFFNLVTIGLAADTMINNNPDFVFRIKFVGQSSGNSGNHRFDNITLEGDTDYSATPNIFSGINATHNQVECSLYPNPANSQVILSTGSETVKTISIYDMEGKLVSKIIKNDANVIMDISALKYGIYILNIIENETGKMANLRMIKN